MAKVDLYAIPADEPSRYFPGDLIIRRFVRKALEPIRDRPPNGLVKVAFNTAQGLKDLGHDVRVHSNFRLPRSGSLVGIIHAPPRIARRISQVADVLVGPGVLNVPNDWPDMFSTQYRVKGYIQACDWQANVFRSLYGHDNILVWPVGIDTELYTPSHPEEKTLDIMVYDKRRWPDASPGLGLLENCVDVVSQSGLTSAVITYGKYGRGGEANFHSLAKRSRAMLFLCENETQGIAYNQVLSMDVPIIAWDQGYWQDPCRYDWNMNEVPATSIPYWDSRCGEVFSSISELPSCLSLFLQKLQSNQYSPRQYILDNLSLPLRSGEYLKLLTSTCKPFKP